MYRELIARVLTRVPIFQDISREAATKLAHMARYNQYAEGTTIFKEGDPGDCLYIIASGKVEIYSASSGGGQIKLNTLGSAEVFGEMALLDGLPRSAAAKVIEKALMFYINRTDFNMFLMQNPEVALKIIETISRRLRDGNNMLKKALDENRELRDMLRETYSLAEAGKDQE